MAFGLLAIVQMSLIAAISLVSVALPAMQQELGLGEIQLTFISAGYGLAFSGLLILGGRLGDAVGPTFTFVTGMTIFGVASGTAGFAPGFGPLLVARFAQGVGAALAAPAALHRSAGRFFHRSRSEDEGARCLGRALRSAPSPACCSPGPSSLGSDGAGFLRRPQRLRRSRRSLPSLCPELTSHPCLASRQRLDSRRPAGVTPGEGGAEPPRLDIIGSVLITTGLSALTYGLLALASGGSLGTAWAVTGLGVAARRPLCTSGIPGADPLVPMAFFKERRLLRWRLSRSLRLRRRARATSFFLSLFLQQVRGLSALQTSAYFTPMLLIVGAGAVAGRWIRRLGSMGGGAGRGPGRHGASSCLPSGWLAGRGRWGCRGFSSSRSALVSHSQVRPSLPWPGWAASNKAWQAGSSTPRWSWADGRPCCPRLPQPAPGVRVGARWPCGERCHGGWVRRGSLRGRFSLRAAFCRVSRGATPPRDKAGHVVLRGRRRFRDGRRVQAAPGRHGRYAKWRDICHDPSIRR